MPTFYRQNKMVLPAGRVDLALPYETMEAETIAEAAKVWLRADRELPQPTRRTFRDDLIPLMIRKDRLEDLHYYAGLCRNANVAIWDAKTDQFYHWRTKWTNTFVEAIDYWDVDGHYDGFIPMFDLGTDPPKAIPIPEPPPLI